MTHDENQPVKEWRRCGGWWFGERGRMEEGKQGAGEVGGRENTRTRAPSNELHENDDERTNFKLKNNQTTREETWRRSNSGKGAGESERYFQVKI